MKFFIPGVKDQSQTDKFLYWMETVALKFMDCRLSKGLYFSIKYKKKNGINYAEVGKDFDLVYGKLDRKEGGHRHTILGILESRKLYLAFSLHRGLISGTPIFIPKKGMIEIIPFDAI